MGGGSSVLKEFVVKNDLEGFRTHYNDEEQRNFSCDGYSLLAYSINCDAQNITDFILDEKVDVCRRGSNEKSPLYVAVEKEDQNLIKKLLQHGAKPTVQSSFLKAIETKNLSVIKYLVENGANVNFTYNNNVSPLSEAIKTGDVTVAEYLVSKGATWNRLKAETQTTCLFDLVQSNHYNMLSFLGQKLKVNLNIPINSDYTCLTLAVEKQNFNMITLLVEHGAKIDAFDGKKRLPLKIAVEAKDLNISAYFINCGANARLAEEEVQKFSAKSDDFRACLNSKLRDSSRKYQRTEGVNNDSSS